jgi:hypothetical protein
VNYDQMLQEVDPAETEWEAFLRAVRLVLDADNFTTRTLMVQIEQIVTLQEVLPDDLREPFFKKHTNAFGRVLLTIVGRRFGESRIRLERVGLNRDKVAVWRVVLEQ